MTTRGKGRVGRDGGSPLRLAVAERGSSCTDEAAPPLSGARVGAGYLHGLLVTRREEILARARGKATARSSQLVTKHDFAAPLALLAAHLTDALGASTFRPHLLRLSAARLGCSWWRNGWGVSELALCYGDVWQASLELASECAAPVDTAELFISSYCLNEARASAIAAHEEQRGDEVSRADAGQLERLGEELTNLLDTALLAFDALRTGNAQLQGQAGTLLDRSLCHLHQKIDQALFRVRTHTRSSSDQSDAWQRTAGPGPVRALFTPLRCRHADTG